jgi:hypothetical protein
MVQISLISDSGQISGFKFAYGIEQVAEAAHGHMWFVDVTGGQAGPRIGFIDSNGQTRFFDAVNADIVGFPNSIVRAPDGAVCPRVHAGGFRGAHPKRTQHVQVAARIDPGIEWLRGREGRLQLA